MATSDSRISTRAKALCEILSDRMEWPEAGVSMTHVIEIALKAVVSASNKRVRSTFWDTIKSQVEVDEENMTAVESAFWDAFQKTEHIAKSTDLAISYEIQCPVCRVKNIVSSKQKNVVGVDNVCCVCLVNCAQIYFPECGHVCVCSTCLILLHKMP